MVRDLPSTAGVEAEITNLTGGGIAAPTQNSTTTNSTSSNPTNLVSTSTSSSSSTVDDDPLGGPSKELSYKQFLELLAAVSHYVIRNPYFALHDRVEKFIATVLASRKKLPTKTFRSAI